jgi:hypothetical protein
MLNDATTNSQRIIGVDRLGCCWCVISGRKMVSDASLTKGDESLSMGVCLGISALLKMREICGDRHRSTVCATQ